MIVLRRRAPLRGYADQGTTTRTWGGWSLILGGIAGLLTYAGTGKARVGAAAGLGVLGAGLTVSAAVYAFKARELSRCTAEATQGASGEGEQAVAASNNPALVCTDAGGLTHIDLAKATWVAGGVGLISLASGFYLWRKR